MNPQILFCKSQTNLQIQELSLNPEKYFENPKKYFVTCYLRQQPATVSGLPHPKWRSLVEVDEEDEERSSSGVLIPALECEISAV